MGSYCYSNILSVLILMVLVLHSNANDDDNVLRHRWSDPCHIESAMAILTTHTDAAKDTKGTINITEDKQNHNIIIKFKLSGLTPDSYHGIHIHKSGNLQNNCSDTGAHFNPNNNTHKAPDQSNRHVGDILANVHADSQGNFEGQQSFSTRRHRDRNTPKLCGTNSVIGRSIVLHQDKDDLGLGTAPTSKLSGNAGPKISCGVIGILTEDQ